MQCRADFLLIGQLCPFGLASLEIATTSIKTHAFTCDSKKANKYIHNYTCIEITFSHTFSPWIIDMNRDNVNYIHWEYESSYCWDLRAIITWDRASTLAVVHKSLYDLIWFSGSHKVELHRKSNMRNVITIVSSLAERWIITLHSRNLHHQLLQFQKFYTNVGVYSFLLLS